MMQSCLSCYRKHIATSMAFENESRLGYPLHKWLAIGELVAAETEVLQDYPELAETTRNYRKNFELQDVPVPTLQLIALATDLEMLQKPQDEAK